MNIYKSFQKMLETILEVEEEKHDNEVRKTLVSKDNTYTFRANFEKVEDINWDMFKNEDKS